MKNKIKKIAVATALIGGVGVATITPANGAINLGLVMACLDDPGSELHTDGQGGIFCTLDGWYTVQVN